MKKFLLYPFSISLLVTLLSMGSILSTQYTLSPLFYQSGLHDLSKKECQPIGTQWECRDLGVYSGQLIDSGAVSWVDIPIALYRHKYGDAKWNPYVGSGYPIAYDGHNRTITPSRIFLKLFPSQQGKDFWIFIRFVFMVWGFVYVFYLWELPKWMQFWGGFFSTLLPYPASFLDIVFMDTDMMAPWLIAWMTTGWKDKKIPFLVISITLGLWTGLQSFVQAQVIFACVFSLLAITLLISQRNQLVFGGSSLFTIGFLGTLLPNVIAYLSKFSLFFVGNRVPGSCFAQSGVGLTYAISQSIRGFQKSTEVYTLFSAFGIFLILFLVLVLSCKLYSQKFFSSSWVQNLKASPYLNSHRQLFLLMFLIYALLLLINIGGMPSAICHLGSISGFRFHRHLSIYTQTFFYILLVVSIFILGQILNEWMSAGQIRARKIYWGLLGLISLLAVLTFIKRGPINEKWLKGDLHREYPFSVKIPKTHPFYWIQYKSNTEDRRHIALDERLYPNWTTAFDILDIRLNPAIQIIKSHRLYTGLFNDWKHESSNPKIPDRFTLPATDLKQINGAMERFFVVTRTSLFSFSKNSNWIPDRGYISKQNCQILSEDQINIVWICPQIGGVGFFPSKVNFSQNEEKILLEMNSLSPEELVDQVWVSDQTWPLQPALGQILKVVRQRDQLTYTLSIKRPGYFIVADTIFPGWHAKINDKELPIVPTSIAWKGIYIPTVSENVILRLEFNDPIL